MAARYWVGGTADWDSTAGTKWALTSGGAGGQAVPTSVDDVFLDAASGNVTITITSPAAVAKTLTCTGFTGTLNGGSMTIYGNVTLSSSMTISYSGRLTIAATGTLTTAGKTLGDVGINAAGGTVTLGSALTLLSSGDISLTAGTLNTSASNFSITAMWINASGAGVKSLVLNASTVTLTYGSENNPAFNYSGSNLTFTPGTSTINLSGGVGATIDGGTGLTFNNVAFTGTAAGSRFIKGANTFNQLTITSPAAAGIVNVALGANQTITTLVASGATTIRRVGFKSTVFGTARTLTVGTYATKSNIDFQDITAAGASSPWSGTSIGNCLGNSNITFTAAKTVYWNLTGAQTWMAAAWATTSGGTPDALNYPLPQDTAVFDNAGAATTVTINSYANVGEISASTRTTAMTLTGGGAAQFYKNITNGPGVTLTLSSSMELSARSTQTITSAGSSFSGVTVNSVSGSNTVLLGDAFVCTGTFAMSGGAGFTANNYSVTVGTFQQTGASISLINLGSATWTVTGSGACWNLTTPTISGTAEIVLSDNTTTARAFYGGAQTYGKLTIGGSASTSTTTIYQTNTFSEIASTKTVAHTIVFPNVTTTVGNFTVRGSAGNLVTLSRTGASGTFTLAKSGAGVINVDYLSVSNSTASPTNTWYAGANSTNGGGNTNWIFTAAPTTAAGNFFNLF